MSCSVFRKQIIHKQPPYLSLMQDLEQPVQPGEYFTPGWNQIFFMRVFFDNDYQEDVKKYCFGLKYFKSRPDISMGSKIRNQRNIDTKPQQNDNCNSPYTYLKTLLYFMIHPLLLMSLLLLYHYLTETKSNLTLCLFSILAARNCQITESIQNFQMR